MADPVNAETVHLIMRNEGCRLDAYQDVGGVWTIGYGHTGEDVAPGMVITQAEAQALLEKDLGRFQDGVENVLKADTGDNQYGAMVSLAFNIGLGHFDTSTVLREHNAGNHEAAAEAFALWNKAGGRVLAGLVRRRGEEAALYLKPDEEASPIVGAPPPEEQGGLIAHIAALIERIEQVFTGKPS